jgi:autotransporter-associated beta strand protein
MNGGTLDLGQVTLANSFSLTGGTVTNGSLVNTQLTSVQGGTVGAVITGTGGLTKTGAQTLTLAAANTYQGDTIVSAGTLLVKGSIDSTQNVIVSTNATLGGSGTVGNVTVNSGGTLAPSTNGSTGYATLNVQSVQLASGTNDGAHTILAIGGTNSGSFDTINSAAALVFNGSLQFTFNNTAIADGNSYQLFTSGGLISGGFQAVSENGLTLTRDFAYDAVLNSWSAEVNTDAYYRLNFNQNNGVLSVLVVPEPSTYAMVGFGIVALLSARYLRRRKIVS